MTESQEQLDADCNSIAHPIDLSGITLLSYVPIEYGNTMFCFARSDVNALFESNFIDFSDIKIRKHLIHTTEMELKKK